MGHPKSITLSSGGVDKLKWGRAKAGRWCSFHPKFEPNFGLSINSKLA